MIEKIDRLIEGQDKLNFLLDVIISGNEKKFNSLPSEIQNILEPYKNKLEKENKLDKKDYEKLKEIAQKI